jgi:NAD(P) transhydrogenase subunit alpha
MKVAIPREVTTGESRVAATPDVVKRLVKKGFEVLIQKGAGEASFFPDSEYEEAGATLVEDARALFSQADLIFKVNAPEALPDGGHEIDLMREGAGILALLFPLNLHELVQRLADRKVTSFSLDQVPRITRAQSMDVLSSQSTVAGYKAVLLAATRTPKFFPMLTTAAGTIRPGKVVILGVGVAGLQAIATARRLGAVVKAYDIRAATKEQVESLGATFIELPEIGDMETEGGYAKELTPEQVKEQQMHLAEHLQEADVIVTTALIPGRPAPRLITKEMATKLRPGTVVLDMAAEAGGNCELTQAGEDVTLDGVVYMGPRNIPGSMPQHASQMFSRNLLNLLLHLAPEGELAMDFEDAITVGSCITHEGKVVQKATRKAMDLPKEIEPPENGFSLEAESESEAVNEGESESEAASESASKSEDKTEKGSDA